MKIYYPPATMIPSCCRCLFIGRGTSLGPRSRWFCMEKGLSLDEIHSIPGWCPLQDADVDEEQEKS